MLTRAEKEKKIVELKTVLKNSSVTIINQFSSISVQEITDVRRESKENNCDFRVVKNSLARLAVSDTALDALKDSFNGPIVISIGYDDPTVPAKILKKHKSVLGDKLEILCGVAEGQFLDKAGILALADMPGRDELLPQLLARLKSPISGFNAVTSGILRKFVYVLKAIEEQKAGDEK